MTSARRSRARAYDINRDGFVIAGGAGVVWCSRSLSMPRPAAPKIYGELVGYGATSDGYDMVAAFGRGGGALHAHGAGQGR